MPIPKANTHESMSLTKNVFPALQGDNDDLQNYISIDDVELDISSLSLPKLKRSNGFNSSYEE